MKMRIFCWVAVPLFLGITSFLAATGQLSRAWFSVVERGPLIDYPGVIDLGEQELGDLAVGRFTITNRGGAELVVDQIQTNCSCTGMERERDGRYERVESLRLKAGGQADLAIRVSVRGVPVNAAMHNHVEFRTNDPTQPTGHIEVIIRRVQGGVSVTPPAVIFGQVPIGAPLRQVLEVRDTALEPRHIERITTTGTERLTTRLLPVEDLPQGPLRHPDGPLIGKIEVVLDTGRAGHNYGGIQIHLAGGIRSPDKVKVAWKVVAPVEMRPSSLVLPRQTANGLVYSAQSFCRSTGGKPLTLVVDSVPPDLTVEVLAGGDASSRIIRVTVDPERAKSSVTGRRQLLHFRAQVGGEKVALQLPVVLQR